MAKKTSVELGKWADGHIPRTAFPMSRLKDKRYKFGPDYSWRIVKFDVGSVKCRILIIINESKEILRSRLGVDVNGDMVVLCDYEFHAGEPGWHCHVTTEQVSRVMGGAARRDKRKWPRTSSRQAFEASKTAAIGIVASHFKFEAQGDLL